MYLIDAPSSVSSLAAWRAHLKMLAGLPQDDHSVQQAMRYAKKWIAQLESETRGRSRRLIAEHPQSG